MCGRYGRSSSTGIGSDEVSGIAFWSMSLRPRSYEPAARSPGKEGKLPMRLKDAFRLPPGHRFGFRTESERTVLKDFSLPDTIEDEATFADQLLEAVMWFLPRMAADEALPGNIVIFLAKFRPIVGSRDYGFLSYGLVRGLAGEVEVSTVELLKTVLHGLQQLTSSNAKAFHEDERLQPEHQFQDAVVDWRISTGPMILALCDVAERRGKHWSGAENLIFQQLSKDQARLILDSFFLTVLIQ